MAFRKKTIKIVRSILESNIISILDPESDESRSSNINQDVNHIPSINNHGLENNYDICKKTEKDIPDFNTKNEKNIFFVDSKASNENYGSDFNNKNDEYNSSEISNHNEKDDDFNNNIYEEAKSCISSQSEEDKNDNNDQTEENISNIINQTKKQKVNFSKSIEAAWPHNKFFENNNENSERMTFDMTDTSNSVFLNMLTSSRESIKELHFSYNSFLYILDALKICAKYEIKGFELIIDQLKRPRKKHILGISKYINKLEITLLKLSRLDFPLNLFSLLLNSLVDNENLSTLIINYTVIKLDDAKAISEMLKSDKTSLKKLKLNNNVISNKKMKELFLGIQKNKTLEYLYIDSIESIPKIIKYIVEILKNNNNITKFCYRRYKSYFPVYIKNEYTFEITENGTKLNIKFSSLSIEDFIKILNAILDNKDSKIREIEYKDSDEFSGSAIMGKGTKFSNIFDKICKRKILIPTKYWLTTKQKRKMKKLRKGITNETIELENQSD